MRWPTLHVVTGPDPDRPGPPPDLSGSATEQNRAGGLVPHFQRQDTGATQQNIPLLTPCTALLFLPPLCFLSPVVSETSCDNRQEPLFEETGKTGSQFKSSSLYWSVSLLLENREVHLKTGFVCSPIQHPVYLTIFIPIQTFPV